MMARRKLEIGDRVVLTEEARATFPTRGKAEGRILRFHRKTGNPIVGWDDVTTQQEFVEDFLRRAPTHD